MRFTEVTHKYVENGVEFTPVTYFLKSFQEKQDWDAIAAKKAKKDGVSKEDLLKQWETKRNKAAERGTAFHKIMEEKYQKQGFETVEELNCPVVWTPEVDGIKEDSSMILQDNTIYTEKMIWNNTFRICGTADLVEVVNGKLNIKDYKTNEKLEFESWKHPNPAIGSRKLLSPVNDLDDCNFNIYQLQLNAYMYMLLQHNRQLKLGKMEVIHVPPKEDGSFDEPKVYKVNNLQRQIFLMLKAYRR